MKYRLIKETDGEVTFWKVQQWSWIFGWRIVDSINSVTTEEQKARKLYDRITKDGLPPTRIEVISER